MTFLHAIILGIIEGVTEFLPVSSTGHLILATKILDIPQTDFVKTFSISIQLGAILAVVVLYGKRFLVSKDTWKKVLLAFIPTGIIGFILYKMVRFFLLGNGWVVVGSLFVVGLLLVVFELWFSRKRQMLVLANSVEAISYKHSLIIGAIQSFGMIPGVSRSGATILGGVGIGISRKAIVEFSFLLAIPTMIAATGYDLFKNIHGFKNGQFEILVVGFLVSFLIAMPFIKFLLGFVQKHSFIWFGVYRILVALVFAFILLK